MQMFAGVGSLWLKVCEGAAALLPYPLPALRLLREVRERILGLLLLRDGLPLPDMPHVLLGLGPLLLLVLGLPLHHHCRWPAMQGWWGIRGPLCESSTDWRVWRSKETPLSWLSGCWKTIRTPILGCSTLSAKQSSKWGEIPCKSSWSI